jgi:hypothetical protein
MIAQRVLILRGVRVMLDADIANLYGVQTKVINQSVRRNAERFPDDFMFRLTEEEKNEVVTNCDHLTNLKFSRVLPCAFTEHGVLMLGNTLKSDRAIEVSLIVVRTFVQLREMLAGNEKLAGKLAELERKVSTHDQAIAGLINAIRQLMKMPEESSRSIGFTADLGNKEKS